jgi:hypothetical protein
MKKSRKSVKVPCPTCGDFVDFRQFSFALGICEWCVRESGIGDMIYPIFSSEDLVCEE